MLVAASALSVEAQAPTRDVAISLLGTESSGAPLTIELRSVDTSSDPVRVTADKGTSRLALPVGSHWTVTSGSASWWLAPDFLSIAAGSGPLQVAYRVWPTGRVRGALRLATKDAKLPATLTIAANTVPGVKRAVPPATITCPVRADATWDCSVPAGTLDLGFRAPGFIPSYRWNARVLRAGLLDVGVLLLRPGSSVAGWVQTPERAVSVAGAHVRIARPTAAGGAARTRERLSRPIAESEVGANGFFQLTGIEPGTYTITATKTGFAPTVLTPVEVYRGAETIIRTPVLLQRPLRFHVTITPAADVNQHPWRVEVRRLPDHGEAEADDLAFAGTTDDHGALTIANQAPGRFTALILDAAKNPVKTTTFTVTAPDQTTTLALDVIAVTGTIRKGERPLAATLHFGGEQGVPRVTTRSDADGHFALTLPHDGEWPVDVAPSDTVTASLDVHIAAAGGKATIDLTVPNNVVTGSVKGLKDEPLRGAAVSLANATNTLWTTSKADGTFVFDAAPDGDVEVMATTGVGATQRQTNSVKLTLGGSSPAPLQLHLLRANHTLGQVHSALGALAGAVVTILSSGAATPPFYARVTTDVDGGFELDVPETLRNATAIVAPPGFALRAFDVPLDGRSLILNVPTAGGTIRLHRPATSTQDLLLVLTQDGQQIPAPDLFQWAESQPEYRVDATGTIDLPNLAPGAYTVCIATSPQREPAPQARCASGTLAAGGLLDLAPAL